MLGQEDFWKATKARKHEETQRGNLQPVVISSRSSLWQKTKSPNISVGALYESVDDYFTDATNCLKLSGSFIARSARILRSRSIFFAFSLLMNTE